MGVRLTISADAWRDHVLDSARRVPGLIPVVKGNGYGFGRAHLAALAADLLGATALAVGTVHEVGDVPTGVDAIVLTPTLDPLSPDVTAVLTVGSPHHVDALAAQGWRGRVVLKLASRMRRYGTHDLGGLLSACAAHHLDPVAVSIHLPLVGDDRHRDVEAWIPRLDVLPAGVTVDVSHIDPDSYLRLVDSHPGFDWRMRMGTALWHGDKSMLHLGVTVVDVHQVRAGEPLGYRQVPCPADGHVALVAGGSAHGITPNDGGLSPFHHARHRLALIEPPHMHTSMVFVPAHLPPVAPGMLLDLQRPLTMTDVDEIVWQ
jgi:alanine racemase